jgi:hypothetical protein
MAGARVTVSNGRLVIVCTGGGAARRYTAPASFSVTAESTRAQITTAITGAKNWAIGAVTRDADADAIDSMSISREVGRVYRQLHPAARAERPAAPRRRRAAPRRETPRREAPRGRASSPTARAALRPTITAAWIQTQLRGTSGGARAAGNACNALHANREFVGRFLNTAANRTAVTVTMFNALYQMSRFRTFLSVTAGREGGDYARLQAYMADPARSSTMPAGAPAAMVRAAAAFTRVYLLEFEATRDVYRAYMQEVQQLPDLSGRLGNDQRLRSYRTSDLDADTVTAAGLYLRRWYLEHPRRGRATARARISAWSAPTVRSATGTAAAPADPQAALRAFAQREWANLATELYNAARSGRPAAIGTLMRNLPQGQTSLESALTSLRRTDIRQAFDRMFNDFLHSDAGFRAFCEGRREFRRVAGARGRATRLRSRSSAADRALIARAVQSFVNFTAGRSDGEQYSRLNRDLRILYRQVLSIERDDLDVNGTMDLRTLAAMSVLTWRRGNQTAAVGHWARSIPNVTIPSATTPSTTPAVPESGQEGRRRVIRY